MYLSHAEYDGTVWLQCITDLEILHQLEKDMNSYIADCKVGNIANVSGLSTGRFRTINVKLTLMKHPWALADQHNFSPVYVHNHSLS